MNLQHFAYYAGYGFSTLLLRQKKPIIAAMPLTSSCNLKCAHCAFASTEDKHPTFASIEENMKRFYRAGVRVLYLQGGEMMTWHDGSLDANDAIRAAKRIGFFRVEAGTNGTLGLPTEADIIWVSLDGEERLHDSIRGAGTYAAIMHTLATSKHPNLNLKMTVNLLNHDEIEAVAEIARYSPVIRGVLFSFHTPYASVNDLSMPLNERSKAIERIIKIKKRGFPVLNKYASLNAMQKNRWKRPVPYFQILKDDKIYTCCWGKDEVGLCKRCGFTQIAELSQLMSLDLAAILQTRSIIKR